jgi:hypothetical protein
LIARGVKNIGFSGKRKREEKPDITLPSPGGCDNLKLFSTYGLLYIYLGKILLGACRQGKRE